MPASLASHLSRSFWRSSLRTTSRSEACCAARSVRAALDHGFVAVEVGMQLGMLTAAQGEAVITALVHKSLAEAETRRSLALPGRAARTPSKPRGATISPGPPPGATPSAATTFPSSRRSRPMPPPWWASPIRTSARPRSPARGRLLCRRPDPPPRPARYRQAEPACDAGADRGPDARRRNESARADARHGRAAGRRATQVRCGRVGLRRSGGDRAPIRIGQSDRAMHEDGSRDA